MTQSIKLCLLFDGDAEAAAKHYVALFPDSAINGVSRYGEGAPYPAGTALLVDFQLRGQPMQTLNGGPKITFSEAVSLSVSCASQAEVDLYWDGLIAGGGSPGQCGWLKDRFGVSWQIVPEAIGPMFTSSDRLAAERAMAAMLKMTKLDIAVLEAAFNGDA